MFLFRVSERFNISNWGLALLPGLGSNFVPVGTPITIVRPDKSEIETRITSIAFDGSNSITIEKSLKKEDVPIGSEVWAKKSITYDLTHYTIIEKNSVGTTCEIIFQHKIDERFLTILKLSGVVGIIDILPLHSAPIKMRIDKTPGSYAFDLSLQLKDDKIKTYHEALIFLDKDCIDFAFRCVAEEITYASERKLP